ncbi:MAG: ribonuclease H-like domain-containing protein [Eubacterium sp.]|nr:ribonuclease H-like domain-containing protein [Eubacterium sp.]
MLTFYERIPKNRISAWEKLAEKYGKKEVAMFDLETTGFSPNNAFIYIIGINLYKDGEWTILQLFNDDGRSEPAMLEEFMGIMKDRTVLFHFNGDRFDIPFVRGRMDKIRQSMGTLIPDEISRLTSVDLYTGVKPMKYALGLPNVRQKTVEQYLGIQREDQYDGGQLISVYLSYLSSGNEHHRDLVLLHNRDDMEGMFHLARMQALMELGDGNFTLGELSTTQEGNRLFLNIPLFTEYDLPKPLETTGFGASLSGNGRNLSLCLMLHSGTCQCRITKQKQEGFFLSAADYTGAQHFTDPAIKRSDFIAADDGLLGNPDKLKDYAHAVVQKLMRQNPRNH